MNNGQTRRMANFASSLRYEELPEEVLDITKICLLDVLGSALFGSTLRWGKIVSEFANDFGCKKESTIIGYGYRTSASYASFANSTMGHGFELDDAYIPAIHHPGCVVIPAALAVGEKEHSSGKEIIAAIVAGYEIMNRIGESVGGSITMRGFFATGTNGVFGASVAAGRLLGLNEEQMVNALGIAGSQASGLLECLQEGAMTKRLGAGTASQGGLNAALLAQKGFTGPSTIVEGKLGYCRAYADTYDLSKLTRNLGSDYTIRSTAFKLYPCCKALHAPIDAVIKLAEEYDIKPDNVERITVGGYEKLVKMHSIYEPPEILSAQFSLPYVSAIALLKRKVDPDGFTDESIRNRDVLKLAKKVKIEVDPELVPYWPEHDPAKVTIKLKDGKEYEETVIDPKGDPRNPISAQELQAKFKSLVAKVLRNDQVMEAIRTINHLEQVEDISSFINLFSRRRLE